MKPTEDLNHDASRPLNCPVSGLPMHRKPEWENVRLDEDYKTTITILKDSILLTQPSGYATGCGMERAMRLMEEVAAAVSLNGPYVQVEDYSNLRGASIEARQRFISAIRNSNQMQALIFCGLPPMLELSLKLAKKFKIPKYRVRIANDYAKAVETALNILSPEKPASAPETPSCALKRYVREADEIVHEIVRRDEWRFEAQFCQAQKMESIETLAAGIAHDFNNILSVIIGYTELALREIPEDAKGEEYLKKVLKAGNRAKNLVGQILTFSRQKKPHQIPIQISPIVNEALRLIRASLPKTIKIRKNVAGNLGTVLADPLQIHQVIMNLCANAKHAMRETGGVLNVNISREKAGIDFTSQHGNIASGPYLKMTFSDTGRGIPQEILGRVFDPYFTTKEVGEGTGLGLAVVHGIVLSHGGAINVRSEPEKGTAFDIYLPIIDHHNEVLEESPKPRAL